MPEATAASVVSNLEVMGVLLAKDWRLFRAPTIALIVVGAACYLISIVSIFYPHSDQDAFNSLLSASAIAFELTGLLAAAFGGVAIAGERADRTADFLGLLPVTRLQIILSKWIVSVSIIVLCALFHLLIAWLSFSMHYWFPIGGGPTHQMPQISEDLIAAMACWVGFTMCLFGIAWLLSTFLRSGPISACISIAATIALTATAALRMEAIQYADRLVPAVLASATFGVGLLSALLGAIYYRHRVAP